MELHHPLQLFPAFASSLDRWQSQFKFSPQRSEIFSSTNCWLCWWHSTRFWPCNTRKPFHYVKNMKFYWATEALSDSLPWNLQGRFHPAVLLLLMYGHGVELSKLWRTPLNNFTPTHTKKVFKSLWRNYCTLLTCLNTAGTGPSYLFFSCAVISRFVAS